MEGAATGMEALGSLFTTITGWMGTMADTIISEPLFLLPLGFFVVGGAIGLCSRLIGR